jgi:hypothetical protein
MLLRTIAFASAVLSTLLIASPGHATTKYVSGTGTGDCSSPATACRNLATALNSASAGDNIVCLSAPVPSAFSLIFSVTIDCSSARAPFAGSGFNTVDNNIFVNMVINAPAAVVRLRGLVLDGSGGGDRGIDIQSAAAVFIEDCMISNYAKQGIYDHRTGGQTKLFIKDTIISGNGAGIVAVSATVGITVLDNVTSEKNTYGIAVGTGNNVAIRNSIFSGNSVAGVEGDSGAQVVVNNSTISHNNIGVQSSSSVRLSNNDIAFNNIAVSGSSGTFGNNRFSGNGSIGTAPTALGGASSDLGP